MQNDKEIVKKYKWPTLNWQSEQLSEQSMQGTSHIMYYLQETRIVICNTDVTLQEYYLKIG